MTLPQNTLLPKSKHGLPNFKENPFLNNVITNIKHGIKHISNKAGDKMMVVSEHGDIVAPAGF